MNHKQKGLQTHCAHSSIHLDYSLAQGHIKGAVQLLSQGHSHGNNRNTNSHVHASSARSSYICEG